MKGDALAPELENERAHQALSLGSYRLFARLGTGGMADVFLAVAHGAMNVNRLVVIKRLREEQASDAGARQMFLNEARLAARLNHPNVIQTFEAGNRNGCYFLAMEYVDGQPLSRLLTRLKRAGKTLEPRLAARICADALSGLHYAHELDDFDGTPLEIVHRDVSPQNLMLTYEGMVKLVDFGIAKAVGTTQTEHGVFKGKVAYMAPEQLLGERVDRRADLFTTGIVLWEAITGRPLMAEESPAKTLWNLMNKRIPALSEVIPNVPRALDAIVARALERDPAVRYQTAREMREALEESVARSGGVTQQEIGDLVQALFADTREKIQSQIKGRLAAHTFRQSMLPPAEDLSHTQIRTTGPVLLDLGEGRETSVESAGRYRFVAASPTITGAHVAPASRTRGFVQIAWVGVTVVAFGASVLALLQSRSAAPAPSSAVFDPTGATTASASIGPTSTANAAPTTANANASATTTAALPIASATPSADPPSTAEVSSIPRPPSPPPPPPPPKPTWVTPPPAHPPTPRAAPPATTSAPAAPDAPRPSAVAPAPPPKSPEPPPSGRTFRRDL